MLQIVDNLHYNGRREARRISYRFKRRCLMLQKIHGSVDLNRYIKQTDNNCRVPSVFRIASERSLDTLNICGLRGRLSQGRLESQRVYQASNKTRVCLSRPFINGIYEEITQDDLDILRAINTKYIEEEIRYKFEPYSSADLIIESSTEKIGNISDWTNLVLDGLAEVIMITPEEIRKQLSRSKDSLPTKNITYSLQKLSSLKAKGIYKVRSSGEVLNIQIDGNLLGVEVGKGSNHSLVYAVIFSTLWGRLYLHNLKSGNITWIREEQYIKLSGGEKNVLYTVMAFPSATFFRKTDVLLELINIKTGKNRVRAIQLLERYLNNLSSKGFITWEKAKEKYTIRRNIEPKSGVITNKGEHDELEQNSNLYLL